MTCVRYVQYIEHRTRTLDAQDERSTKASWKSNKMWHKTILLNIDRERESEKKQQLREAETG